MGNSPAQRWEALEKMPRMKENGIRAWKQGDAGRGEKKQRLVTLQSYLAPRRHFHN